MKAPPTLAHVQMVKPGIHTFSNGTEWECWADANCYACRWWDADEAGALCAFEGAALLASVSPKLAALFGWLQTTTEYGPLSGWEAPDQCRFFAERGADGDDGDIIPFAPVDPAQLTFLPPDGWPDPPALPPSQIPEFVGGASALGGMAP